MIADREAVGFVADSFNELCIAQYPVVLPPYFLISAEICQEKFRLKDIHLFSGRTFGNSNDRDIQF